MKSRTEGISAERGRQLDRLAMQLLLQMPDDPKEVRAVINRLHVVCRGWEEGADEWRMAVLLDQKHAAERGGAVLRLVE